MSMRMDILRLALARPMTARAIAENLGVTRAQVSAAMSTLLSAGLAESIVRHDELSEYVGTDEGRDYLDSERYLHTTAARGCGRKSTESDGDIMTGHGVKTISRVAGGTITQHRMR